MEDSRLGLHSRDPDKFPEFKFIALNCSLPNLRFSQNLDKEGLSGAGMVACKERDSDTGQMSLRPPALQFCFYPHLMTALVKKHHQPSFLSLSKY